MSGTAADEKAPWGRDEDGKPCLPLGHHWMEIPELVDERLDEVKARLLAAQPGQWRIAADYEGPADMVLTSAYGNTSMVGRVQIPGDGDLELVLHATEDLAWCLELIAMLREGAK